MSDGKIYITISDSRTGEVIKDTNITVNKPVKEEKNENILGTFAKHQFFNLIESEAKQMVNYTLGNIGNFNGDYNAQRQINYGLSAMNHIKSIGVGAYAGFVATGGNPLGALIGAGISATTQLINFGLQLHSENIETRKQNYNISQLRQLSGLDGLTNGSRI